MVQESTGGYNVKATQNIPFEIITPSVQTVTVEGTSLTAELRTTTKSLSGDELPYLDTGFESIALNQANYLDSPRMITSKVNEDAKLLNTTGQKSMNMRLLMNTTDTRVSPVIDGQRVSAILTSNRANSIITNYATDARVNVIENDPTACQYISKEIVLEQSKLLQLRFLLKHMPLPTQMLEHSTRSMQIQEKNQSLFLSLDIQT